MKKLPFLFLFLAYSCMAEEFSCQDWAETYSEGCIDLLHHIVYGDNGKETHVLQRPEQLEFLHYCNVEQDVLTKECIADQKRRKGK
jgi:hypothetical protein